MNGFNKENTNFDKTSTSGEKRELLDRRHFHEHFDTDAYLRDFYTKVEDPAMQMVLHHLPNIVARLGRVPSLLDFGSGPTIHVAVCFRDSADEIFLADYLPQNRAEVSRWMNKESAFDWSTVLKIVAVREAISMTHLVEMEQKAREKVKSVLYCNCHQSPAVELKDGMRNSERFSCITSFFTIEYCCLDRYEYANAIQNVCELLAPKGVLILGGVLEETWCAFGGRQFKCLYISRAFMLECLRGAGMILERDQLGNELFYELDGMYILVSRKEDWN